MKKGIFVLFVSIGVVCQLGFSVLEIREIRYRKNLSFFNDWHPSDVYSPINGQIKKIECSDYSNEIIYKSFGTCRIIFPEKIECGELQFFLFSKEEYLHARGEVYLEWDVGDADIFASEKERISKEYGCNKKRPLYSNDLFSLSSYTARYNYDGEYEYALFDETNYVIRYIYLSDVGKRENIICDYEYQPTKMLYESDLKNILSNKYEYHS